MKNTLNLRTQIRQEIRDKRRSLSSSFQQQAAKSLVTQIAPLMTKDKPQSVALYLSNDGELSTQELIAYCWQQQTKVYLPVIHPFSKGHLLFLAYTPDTQMTANKYGIAEPALDVSQVYPAHAIDMIFTPLVAFDNTGARLGMGGGFYDRTLAQLEKSNAHTQVIGLAHDCQCVEQIPTEAWDMPLEQIITPTSHYRF
ncbi:5-formyltetrahydrofolate cyclo-ligase [Thalassotalea marina]|uniref:5-formyltetrahydrofolate cyclo-ligase n=1 Tax=Thalassotalea marina TaxID=1673741 RepID=A0A919BBM3_9GAMM|nr:5-formyltetrahydrofolate cyclo-ligase [Thalassotalea marina]GHF81045.1 5-formyltetrahydrofolate cyclo-ligase [Thalassotalea marina]